MRTLLSILFLGFSLSAGTAHAYLSPGEVFPDLNVEEAQAPVQAPTALTNTPEENAKLAADESFNTIYLIAAVLLIGAAATTYMRKKPAVQVPAPTAGIDQ
jgi:Na+/glutamate symporter